MDDILINNFLVNSETYNCYQYTNERLKLFDNIIKNSKNRNLFLFFTPIHYRQIFAIKHLGLFNKYIQWMGDIKAIVDKYKDRDGYNIKLFDFSYPNYITTETVSSNMKYYWESSHYKSNVGDKIVNKIFNSKNNFGLNLNNENIKKYLKDYTNRYFKFMRLNKQEYNDIYFLYKKTTKERIKRCKKYKNFDTILKRKNDYDPIKNLNTDNENTLKNIEL